MRPQYVLQYKHLYKTKKWYDVRRSIACCGRILFILKITKKEKEIVEAYGAGRGRTYMLSHKLYEDKGKAIGYVRQKDIDEARYPEMIINMAKSHEFIARADVVNLLHVSPSKAYTLLKQLADRDILVPINKGRYAKYQLRD